MRIAFGLNRSGLRAALVGLAMTGFLLFAYASIKGFALDVAADPNTEVRGETLELAAAYFPDSAKLQARIAARLIERGAISSETPDEVADRAVRAATRAVLLAPSQHENWLLLAAARELQGELREAEAALVESLKRAPNDINVHWRFANLLLRENKLERALEEFRAAQTEEASRWSAAWELVWRASGERPEALFSITNNHPKAKLAKAKLAKAKLALARFLIGKERVDAALGILKAIGAQEMREMPEECSRLIDELLASRRVEAASELWREAVGVDVDLAGFIWNGGFETPIRSGFAQFDWRLKDSEYARIGISPQARTGEHALRLLYLGRETTKLADEIQRVIVVRPGTRYRMECFARAENLSALAGPQIVATHPDSGATIASTSAVEPGEADWQPLVMEFNVPPDLHALMISVRQTPQFSYVDPTRGTILFDDFVLTRR